MRNVGLLLLLLVLGLPTTSAAITPTCLPKPLPIEPIPPTFITEARNSFRSVDERVHVELWRHPCLDGSGAALLMRVTPLTLNPLFCAGFTHIRQGELGYGAEFLDDPAATHGAGCNEIRAPQTLMLSSSPGNISDPPLEILDAFEITFFAQATNVPNSVLSVPTAATPPVSLVAAILPSSRAVQVGQAATAFATIIATGEGAGVNCTILPLPGSGPPVDFVYQQTDPDTNALIGEPNTPVNIPGGNRRTFMIALTPSDPQPSTFRRFRYDCDNTLPAPEHPAVDAFALRVSLDPTPDVITIAATSTGDGIASIPGVTGTAVFSVSSVNIGVSSLVRVEADTVPLFTLPVLVTLCETNPTTGICINPATPSSSVMVQMNTGHISTFSIFLKGMGHVPFVPASNRAVVRFLTLPNRDSVGETAVAIRTIP